MAKPDISLAEAIAQSLIAQTVSKEVFDREFGGLKGRLEKQENQSFQVIIGVLIASVLILVTVAVSVILFVANYNQHMLDSEQKFSQGILDIRKENADMQTSLLRELDHVKERQEYLERLLLQKTNDSIPLPK